MVGWDRMCSTWLDKMSIFLDSSWKNGCGVSLYNGVQGMVETVCCKACIVFLQVGKFLLHVLPVLSIMFYVLGELFCAWSLRAVGGFF